MKKKRLDVGFVNINFARSLFITIHEGCISILGVVIAHAKCNMESSYLIEK